MSDARPPRLLIVDDEAAQLKALCDTLTDQGYEPFGFALGRDALAALRETRFDLLLTDLMMPGMDGISLLRAGLEIDPNLVGIIMTGEGTIATAVEAMKTGALDYILKPFKLSLMIPVLSRALTVRRLRMDKEELERDLTERTTQLEFANKELEAFAYSVSHDLRAPLRAIHGFSSVLMEDYSPYIPVGAQSLLIDVVDSAKRMEQLIEDLLRFSRVGRHQLDKVPVSVSEIVGDVLREVRRNEIGRDIDVKIGELPAAFADISLLRQVFVNLLSNAVKFTRQTEHAVIEVGSEQQGAETVYFVRDNGAGFNMRYADKLFGVFQRLHTSEQFEGTGVGLSIVHRIIQRHGGRIWADAKPDAGATFYITVGSANP